MIMDISYQRRVAARMLKCGVNRVWISPEHLDEVADAITREDIRELIDRNLIQKRQKKGVSRGRARYAAAQKKKGRRKGPGSRKGKKMAGTSKKERWMSTIRPIRAELKSLRDSGKINPHEYRIYYRRAKGGMYKSKSHLKLHLRADGHIQEE